MELSTTLERITGTTGTITDVLAFLMHVNWSQLVAVGGTGKCKRPQCGEMDGHPVETDGKPRRGKMVIRGTEVMM
jgi:hypothetical protein